MSWIALAWAEKAPVADVYERVILMQMAARASNDGTGVWLSQETMAVHCVSDEKTIKRRLDALQGRGVIARGDQRLVEHIRADHRPTVYDLMIPFRYFNDDQLIDINEERARYGRQPLTAAIRPVLAPVEPSRKRRIDAGVKRPIRDSEEQPLPTGTGGLQVHGVTSSPPRGDYKSGTGGLAVQHGVTSRPPIQSRNLPEESVLEPAAPDEPVLVEVPPLFPVGVCADRDPDEVAPVRRPDPQRRAREQREELSARSHRPDAVPIVERFELRTSRLSRTDKKRWWVAVSSVLDLGYSVEVVDAALDRCIADGAGWGLLESKALIVANQARFKARRPSAPEQKRSEMDRLREEMRAMDAAEAAGQLTHATPRAITGDAS